MVNYYVELGLDRAASASQLESDLKALRRKWTGRASVASDTEARQKAERMVDMIRECTEILLNEEKKRKYDKELDKKGAPTSTSQQTYEPRVDTSSMEGAALMDALEQAYDKGNYNQAIAAGNQLLKNGVDDVDVFRYLVFSYAEKGDDTRAYELMKKLGGLKPDDPDAQILIATVYLRLLKGREAEAKPYIDALNNAGYGENGRVCALDVEYQIDTDNFTLAEQKCTAYLAKNSNDSDFRRQVANAYVQYADKYISEVGGDFYIDSVENFRKYSDMVKKAHSICPNADQAKYLDTIKELSKRHLLPDSWMGIVCCFLYIFAGFSINSIPAVVALVALLCVEIYFSLVPDWMLSRYAYKKHLCGLYEVFRYINIFLSLMLRLGWALVKFAFRLALGGF